jgi:hypothetical protein
MATDYRSLFNRDYMAAFEFEGKDLTLTIARVEGKMLKSQRGEELKPVIWFEGRMRALVANKTNSKTIAAMYGTHVEDWVGKKITLYPTTTTAGDQGVVDCIRVRPGIPKENAQAKQAKEAS